jgi:nitroimidazol reductase NimA-like FMN-containing flavoprotein (pyridoxamine 5'-phosphate oxidase superfamily)
MSPRVQCRHGTPPQETYMFTEMRRKDKQMPDAAALELLGSAEYGILATVGANGYPSVVPLNYAMLDGRIYFHSAMDGEKLRNLEATDKVSFCVVADVELLPEQLDTNYRSVVAYGRAREASGEEKKAALVAMVAKYSSRFMDKGMQAIEKSGGVTRVIGIDIERLTGKFQSPKP